MTENFDPTGGYSREATRQEMRRRLTEEDIQPRTVEDAIRNFIQLCQQNGKKPRQCDFARLTGTPDQTVSRHWPKN